MGLVQDDHTSLERKGKAAFGSWWTPDSLATAPGRLELLGNHVDYNGGLVLAGAIDRVIHAMSGPAQSADGSIRLHAPDVQPGMATVDPSAPSLGDSGSTRPSDYLAGIIQALREASVPVRTGLDIVVSGDVPVGFGMSSSAALCVSLTMLLAETELTSKEIVAIARRAERAAWRCAEEHGMDGDGGVNSLAIMYLNRLSDLLFIMSRAANGTEHEVLWVPGTDREKPTR